MTTKTLEECAEIVLRKWPQTRACGLAYQCSAGPGYLHSLCECEGGRRSITPAELLADPDGRPSKWLWALFVQEGGTLDVDHSLPLVFRADADPAFCGAGVTATEAITRALCALAEAS